MASELEVGKVTTGAGTGGDDPKVIVGGEGNAQLRARHIDGKGSTNSNTGKLFLNHYSTSDITMAVGGGNVGINTSSVEAGWSTSCAPIFEISGSKPTLILEEPSVGEYSFVTKNGNLYISDEENNAARLTIDSTGLATFSAGVTVSGGLTSLGSFSELTINSGQITVTQSVHTVDTEGDAASDDLETINGGTTGSILVLKSVTGSRHVVLKDGTDNLRLNGDCELGISNDTITLMKVSTVWREMSRSLN